MKKIYKYILAFVWFSFFCFGNAAYAQCSDGGNYWKQSWKSCRQTANPNVERGDSYWILYEFEEPIGIGDLHIWNANREDESDQGGKEVYIDVSKDGTEWTAVEEEAFDWPIANEQSDYEGFKGPSLSKFGLLKKILFTIKSNHGGTCVSIAEIKFNVDLNACEGIVDECGVCDGTGKLTFYLDADADGKGNKNTFVQSCDTIPPNGYVLNDDDDCDTGGWEQVGNLFEANSCTGCHNETAESGLNLKTYAGFLSGGNKCGDQILSGTTLIDIINNDNYNGCGQTIEGLSMNARVGGAVDDFEMAVIQAWIDAGAPEGDDCTIVNSTIINFPNLSDGDVFDEGIFLRVDVEILDLDGVDYAELFLNDRLVRRINGGPFQWGAIANVDPLLENMEPGTYVFKVVASDNTGDVTENSITIVIKEVEIEEEEEEEEEEEAEEEVVTEEEEANNITSIKVVDLYIVPNPVEDTFSLSKVEEVSVESLSIYSIEGKLLANYKDESVIKSEINVSFIESGLYILIAETKSKNTIVKKFIKK